MNPGEPRDLLHALRGGPATLDALHARLGAPPRDALSWALDDAVERGWVHSSAAACGPDGICSTSAPPVFTLTPDGRAAAAR
jgi:hypothetical protein